MKIKGQKGFTMVEVIVVVAISSILAVMAVSSLAQYKKKYTFNGYVSQMEYLVKFAKVYAMEHTTNVGVCVGSPTITLYDMGTNRGASACSGTAITQKLLDISPDSSYISLSGTNPGVSFDPRGLAIQIGYTCLSYNNSEYVRMCVSRAGVRRDPSDRTGAGGCSSCSS